MTNITVWYLGIDKAPLIIQEYLFQPTSAPQLFHILKNGKEVQINIISDVTHSENGNDRVQK